MQRIRKAGLSVDAALADFIEQRALPGTGLNPDTFWQGFAALIHEFGPRNRSLLVERERLQDQIDTFHIERRGQPWDAVAYRAPSIPVHVLCQNN